MKMLTWIVMYRPTITNEDNIVSYPEICI